MAGHTTRKSALAFLLTVLSACGGGSSSGGGSSDGPGVDPLPVLKSTTPANGQTGVVPTQAITAEFSEPMDPASFNPSTFDLTSVFGSVTGAISISADQRKATFTPSSPLPFGTLITATLTTEVSSASGQSLNTDYAWIFTTHKPAWSQSPMSPDSGMIGNGLAPAYPDVAMDNADNVVAVWRQLYGGDYRVAARRAVGESGWEWTDSLIDNAGGESRSPVAGIDGSGQILVVWADGSTLWYSRAGLTGNWDAPLELTTTAAPPTPSQLLVDAEGNALLFYSLLQSGDNAYVLRFDADSGWESPSALPTRYTWLHPAAAMDDSGFAIVIWGAGSAPPLGGMGMFQTLLARRFIPASGWTATETVAPVETNRWLAGGTVSMDGAENGAVSWMRQRNAGSFNVPLLSDRELHVRRCSADSWGPDEMGPNTVGHEVMDPALRLGHAFAPSGEVTLTWRDVMNARCWASRQTSPGQWSDREAIDLDVPNGGNGLGQTFAAEGGRVGAMGVNSISGGGAGAGYGMVWVNELSDSGWIGPSPHYSAAGYILFFKLVSDAQGRAAAIWLEHTQLGAYGSSPVAVRCSRYR